NSKFCRSLRRKTRTACTSTSTPTVATTAAGTLKIGSAGLGSDCSVKMTPDRRNRPPRRREQGLRSQAAFSENKREDHCPPFCNFAAFAAYRNRRRARAFGKLLARLGAVTPPSPPILVTPP